MDAIRLVCPECDAVHRVKNITLGKLYRCKKCKAGLITMQPAVLVCPACGATRPPAHIEVSRLVTCDECEQMPLMQVRIAGVTMGGELYSGEDTAAPLDTAAGDSAVLPPPSGDNPPENAADSVPFAPPPAEASMPEQTAAPAAALAAKDEMPLPSRESETAAAPSPELPESAPHSGPPAPAADSRKIMVPAAADDDLPPPSFGTEEKIAAGLDTKIIRKIIAENPHEPPAAPDAPEFAPAANAEAETPDAGIMGESVQAAVYAGNAVNSAGGQAYYAADSRRPRPGGSLYDDGGESLPVWVKNIGDDLRELKRHLGGQRASAFSRPVFSWLCLGALIALYGWLLSTNDSQKTIVAALRKEIEAVRSDYSRQTQRINELENEKRQWAREKSALENDLRIYYNKLSEKQREVNMLNKAYNSQFGGPEIR